MLMKTRFQPIDFNLIPQEHEEMHKRLENWARWLHGGGGTGGCQPMFRLYRPDNFERGPMGLPVDGTDAQRIQKALSHHKTAQGKPQPFPQKHRIALNWFYVKPVNPKYAAQTIGTSLEGLAEHVREGRQMLINRKV